MPQLVKIGNSQGIRIPKAIIEQAHLDGRELKLKVTKEGLLITPGKLPRSGWENSIKTAFGKQETEKFDQEWLDATLTNDEEIDW